MWAQHQHANTLVTLGAHRCSISLVDSCRCTGHRLFRVVCCFLHRVFGGIICNKILQFVYSPYRCKEDWSIEQYESLFVHRYHSQEHLVTVVKDIRDYYRLTPLSASSHCWHNIGGVRHLVAGGDYISYNADIVRSNLL